MYAVIRNYQDESTDFVNQLRERETDIKGLLQAIEGFVAYYLLDTGNGAMATVSVYTDRAGAEESTRAAGKFIQDAGLADSAPNPPTVTQGEVVIDAAR